MKIPLETPVSGIPFVAFDTETTGLDLVEDRLLDVGALRFRLGHEEREYASLVRPGRSIPEFSIAIHHITEAMVEDAPYPSQVLEELSRVVDGTVLLAHNAPFDMAMLTLELRRQNMRVPDILVLDTCVLAEALMPDEPTLKLGMLMKKFGSDETNNHRALPDARCAARLFEHVCSRAGGGKPTWGDLISLHGPAFELPKFAQLSVQEQWHYAVAVNAIEERRTVKVRMADRGMSGPEIEVRPRGFGMRDGRWVVLTEKPAVQLFMDQVFKMEKYLPPTLRQS